LPSFIGRYRVERELGRGAMGVIYKADDPDIGRTVAIKLVRADLLEGDDRDQFLARFRHEARAAGRCTHPNIVALYDFAMHEGNPFLAMEFVHGVALGAELKRVGRFAPALAVAIVNQVLDALGAAHALGVVHRDVKPANILLLPSGQVKVTDFGISRLNTSDLTQDGTVIGTPAYMSPEQCRGEEVDARSDLFSAGSVLYELLSGTRAFTGRNSTDVTQRLLTVEPRELTEFVPEVSVALAGALRQAMAKPQEARYASAQMMADALRGALRNDVSASEERAGDQTVVMAKRPKPEPAAGVIIDDATLDTIERRLARHVGPIARHLVRDAARRSSSIEALYEAVSHNISQAAERDRFIAEARDNGFQRTGNPATRSTVARPSVSSSAIAMGGSFSPAQIERAERALTKAVGPIAKLLVKRALPNAASEEALWERLAAHIDRPAERETFLRQRTEG
jgi:eukaryotic-like serine/threonine-protein kinase